MCIREIIECPQEEKNAHTTRKKRQKGSKKNRSCGAELPLGVVCGCRQVLRVHQSLYLAEIFRLLNFQGNRGQSALRIGKLKCRLTKEDLGRQVTLPGAGDMRNRRSSQGRVDW